MFSRELSFDDALVELPVSIVVQSVLIADERSVFIRMEWGDGVSATEADVPCEQVQKLIEALQEALDEG